MSVWKGEKGEGVHLGGCCDKPGTNREGGNHITWGEKEGEQPSVVCVRLGEQPPFRTVREAECRGLGDKMWETREREE